MLLETLHTWFKLLPFFIYLYMSNKLCTCMGSYPTEHILIYEKELRKYIIMLAILNTVIACVFNAGHWIELSCRQPYLEDRTC